MRTWALSNAHNFRPICRCSDASCDGLHGLCGASHLGVVVSRERNLGSSPHVETRGCPKSLRVAPRFNDIGLFATRRNTRLPKIPASLATLSEFGLLVTRRACPKSLRVAPGPWRNTSTSERRTLTTLLNEHKSDTAPLRSRIIQVQPTCSSSWVWQAHCGGAAP